MSSNTRGNSNYYEILEVAVDAPQNEIHKAYQRAKQTYSQDNPALYSMFTKAEARELSRLIEEAYAVLGNYGTRRTYDESLQSGPASTGSGQEKVAAQHGALPDFVIPEADEVGFEEPEKMQSKEQKPKSSQNHGLAPGMAKTPLGVYKVDEEMESEIHSTEDCDGGFLQKVRIYKSIELDKVSEYTRISRTYLTALETNNYRALPAAVFVRGFVVQVAKLLGLNESKVAASYMKRFKANVENQ